MGLEQKPNHPGPTANSVTDCRLAEETVTITVNGEPFRVSQGLSLEVLAAALRINPRGTAIEVNQELIPRAEYANRRLADGDRVEVVTLVGGG